MRLVRFVIVVACLFGIGCGPPKPTKTAPTMVGYEGEMTYLFDDQIDPVAVGMSMDGQDPAEDPLLRKRTRESDVVAKVRVQTVNRKSVGDAVTYMLGVQVGRPTLMPDKLEEDTYELEIDSSNPSFSLVQSVESELKKDQENHERTFIGFIRRFRGDDGPELHWHLTLDSPEVVQVIQEVALLEEAAKNAPGEEQE